jgi:hypothetical protein
MLAEGGEGRVFQLPLQPHLVLKEYRRPADRSHLDELVAWPSSLPDGPAAVVGAASAWPCSVVTGASGEALGLLLPRAPRRFALRHRDGNSRLASLSYLTADPAHREAAYGLRLPAPGGAERVGLAYALSRLLAVFESAAPAVAHGDLSTKNILWSLQRAAEVFVIDCDNSELYDPAGDPLGRRARRRAMTPNWNDPAVGAGENPTPASDRYSLALVFLRVVGAANFPIQARQREGGPVRVEVALPPVGGLRPGDPVWDLCARGLSTTDPAGRPTAGEWAAALEAVLAEMGSADVAAAVRTAQGGWSPLEAARPARRGPGDVQIVPVPAGDRPERRWSRVNPAHNPLHAGAPAASGPGGRVAAGGLRSYPPSRPAATATAMAAGLPGGRGADDVSVWPELLSGFRQAVRLWAGLHRDALSSALTAGRRARAGRLAVACAAVDLALAIIAGFVLAILIAPMLGL